MPAVSGDFHRMGGGLGADRPLLVKGKVLRTWRKA